MALEGLGAWSARPASKPAGKPWQQYRYNGKEQDVLTGWYEYGFRWYIDGIGRFSGVDPIADQFAHVSVYNYAENEPVGHIDLWGLQKFYGEGVLLGTYKNSSEERVVHNPNNFDQVRRVLSEGTDIEKYKLVPKFMEETFSAPLLRGKDLDKVYDKFALENKNKTDRERAMMIYSGVFIDEYGCGFMGFQCGSIAEGPIPTDTWKVVYPEESTIPWRSSFWSFHSAIHTHISGSVDNFSGYYDNAGPRNSFGDSNDIGWSIFRGVPLMLTVPSSDNIATFSPLLYRINMKISGANPYEPSSRNPQIRKSITTRKIGE